MAKNCQICGKPSGMYPLCPACFKLRDAGEVIKCEECKAWHKKYEPCQCGKVEKPIKEETIKKQEDQTKITEIKNTENGKRKCLLCDNEAGDNHFCPSCYRKHKDHYIIVSIKNCKDVDLIEKYAEGVIYVCKDGHRVRSKSEMLIDDFLHDHGIMHCYEYAFPVNMEETIYPDFYLPGKDIYIEHFGINNSEKYRKSKEYKIEIYKKKGVTIICTDEDDMQRPEFSLKRKLDFCEKNTVNYYQ